MRTVGRAKPDNGEKGLIALGLLDHLKGLNNLEVLTLKETQVTDEGVKQLRERLPNTQIEY